MGWWNGEFDEKELKHNNENVRNVVNLLMF